MPVGSSEIFPFDRHKSTFWACGVWFLIAAVDLAGIGQSLPRPQFGDEWRYLYYANNLLHGYFSPHDRIFLWNGPLYPLLLTPFVRIDWLDGARFANAFMHAGAMVYAWLIVREYASPRWSLCVLAVLALYPPIDEHLPLLYTEVACVFFLTAWMYHGLRGRTNRWHQSLAGIFLGLLALTKVVFGSVLIVFLIALAAVRLRRHRAVMAGYVGQALIAILLCVPYLTYTYRLTGRPLYWSSSGANNFYWLTSPSPDEWGDWYHHGWVYSDPTLYADHKDVFDRTTGLGVNPDLSWDEQLFNVSTPEAADVFLARGLENVREHPLKFAINWCANVARLFFDVPVSVRGTPFWNVYTVSNIPLLVWTLFVAIYARRRQVPFPAEWTPLAFFALLTLGTYSVVSSMARFLIPLVPLWWLAVCRWFADANRAAAAIPNPAPSLTT